MFLVLVVFWFDLAKDVLHRPESTSLVVTEQSGVIPMSTIHLGTVPPKRLPLREKSTLVSISESEDQKASDVNNHEEVDITSSGI